MSDDVRIWKFHARLDRQAEKTAHEILRLAARYYNNLVEIERDRYARFAKIRHQFVPELIPIEHDREDADALVRALYQEAKSNRQRHWQRTGGERTLAIDKALNARIEAAKAERDRLDEAAKPYRNAFKKRLAPGNKLCKERREERAQELSIHSDGRKPGPRTREKANAQVLEEMLEDASVDLAWRLVAASDHEAHQLLLAARSTCGVAPGTYLQTERAIAQAKKDSLPMPPKFHSFRGNGKVSVQLTGSVRFRDLLSGTPALTLTPNPIPGRKGKGSEHFRAALKIGTGRDAVCIHADVRLHRMPPPDTMVKWAWLKAKKQGERTRWELQLTLSGPEITKPRRPPGVGKGGHIRIGWSKVDEGVRVALWDDGELVVPRSMLQRAERAELLESHAKRHYNYVCKLLRRWQRLGGSRIRWDWLNKGSDRKRLFVRRLAVEYATLLLGADTLRDLWRAWRDAGHRDLFLPLAEARRWLASRRIETADAELAWWLYTWARKDQHLRQWSADARVGFENARDALFRETAIRLATQHETWTVDEYSIADMKKRPRPITRPGEAPNEVAQRHAQLVAPGRFREILLATMGPRCQECERPGGAETPEPARKPRNRKGKRVKDAASVASAS